MSVGVQASFYPMLDDALSAYCKMGGPRTDPKPTHRRTLTGKVNGKVTRVRTGCLTCRGRRKKCDERKPGCGNCEKAGYHCEGYPAKLRWKEGRGVGGAGAGAGASPSSQPEILEIAPNSMTSGPVTRERVDEGTASYEVWSNQTPLAQLAAPVEPTYNTTFAQPTIFEDGLETLYTPLAHPQHSLIPLESGLAYFNGGYEQLDNMAMLAGSGPSSGQHVQIHGGFNYLSPISRSLPYPIENIRTDIEKLLFYHFTEIFSPLLTTSNVTGDVSPFSEVVIPLAIKDRTVMKTILSLSGSHFLKGRCDRDSKYEIERRRLHSSAVAIQTERKDKLMKWSETPPATRHVYTLEEQEILLATSLILCLYELCEGNSDVSLQEHLDMARSSITIISTTSNDIQPSEAAERITTEVHPLLLEFFNYHDSHAAVTIPTTTPKPQYISKHAAAEKNRISLIGEDLMRFMNRIAPLRAETSTGIRATRAASIHHDLERWKPHSSFSKDQKMISEFYKWALSVWLFSIIRPENKNDQKIQAELPLVLSKMQNISDSVKACLLFPLFIAGGAAVCEEDKEIVRGLFRMLMDWSSLGNIGLALKVVENMWKHHDQGILKAWDWVDQLQGYGMTLLVT